jgi:hypothetical protein
LSQITSLSDLSNIVDVKSLVIRLADYFRSLNSVINGQIEFGLNIKSQTVSVTFGAANRDVQVNHTLGKVGVSYIPVSKNISGDVFTGVTSATTTALFLRSNVANLTVSLILF